MIKGRSSVRRGFTLIQVIVVLGIMALLTGLLFPVFGHLRLKGQQTTCISNLTQIHRAISLYVQDHDSHYPQRDAWKRAVLAYGKNSEIFLCPTRRERPDFNGYFTEGIYSNYHYNRYLDAGLRHVKKIPAVGGVNESVLLKASQIIMNTDIDVGGPYAAGQTECGDYSMSIVHFSGSNYLFCDGHIKLLTPRQAAELNCEGVLGSGTTKEEIIPTAP